MFMETSISSLVAHGARIAIADEGREIGHAYLYILKNDQHTEPFGLIEDVFVEEAARGQGAGRELLKALIEEAKKRGCYKLIATSRHGRNDVHAWYQRLGFRDHGTEFRMDLK